MRKKPRGKTTVSPSGLVKKNFWLHPDEADMLRRAAFEQEVSQAELVRAAVREYFGMAPAEAAGEESDHDE